jgi:hypothetical protein
MPNYVAAIIAALPPLLVAITAWIRAEAAHRRITDAQRPHAAEPPIVPPAPSP